MWVQIQFIFCLVKLEFIPINPLIFFFFPPWPASLRTFGILDFGLGNGKVAEIWSWKNLGENLQI